MVEEIDSRGGMSPLIKNNEKCASYHFGNCIFIIVVATNNENKQTAVLEHLDTNEIAPTQNFYVINNNGEIVGSELVEKLEKHSHKFYKLAQMYKSDDSLGEGFDRFKSYKDSDLKTFLESKFGESFWIFLQEGLPSDPSEYAEHMNPYNLMTFFVEGLMEKATTENIDEFKILFSQLSQEIRHHLYLSQINSADLDLYPYPEVAKLTEGNKVELIIGEGLAINSGSLVNYLDAVEKVIAFHQKKCDLQEITIWKPKHLNEQCKNRVIVVGVNNHKVYFCHERGYDASNIGDPKNLVIPESIKIDFDSNKSIRWQILEGFGIPFEWDYTDSSHLLPKDKENTE